MTTRRKFLGGLLMAAAAPVAVAKVLADPTFLARKAWKGIEIRAASCSILVERGPTMTMAEFYEIVKLEFRWDAVKEVWL